MKPVAAVILAAGKGTRMRSHLPKVLHKVCGRPLLTYVLEAVKKAGVERIVVVVGFGAEQVVPVAKVYGEIVYQEQQLGTAHALLQAEKVLAGFAGDILVLGGDTPLITSTTLARLIETHQSQQPASGNQKSACFLPTSHLSPPTPKTMATVLTAKLVEPAGYGRVIRNSAQQVVKIVEQKDASLAELAVQEINSGIYCFAVEGLFKTLARLKAENAAQEYYLPDVIETYVRQGLPVAACLAEKEEEIQGINDRCQLAAAEDVVRQQVRNEIMLSGVTILDPLSTFIDSEVKIEPDTVIYPFTIIEGACRIGANCIIGPGTRLKSVQVGDNVVISNSVVIESTIGDSCTIGPFAYLRPGTHLARKVKVGDFVEIKQSVIEEGSKIPHLSYVGDAHIGKEVNVGAGTITCNYDGQKKWLTVIEDKVFIGSNTNLVAPVKIGAGAFIGAGSTITKNVPAAALGVARGGQRNIPNWTKKKKQTKEENIS
ncbi:bifunctional N-acetylglucosamine-1-phosphate uridyltransferase/glucosamine-1-phosphate acetyltransferase [Peptococcaceae bacterium SCADC1_2_3]|nr:bifunctional N-acetylglucosamine-1-phosphate uridyltransferase/glucosamine-1-phosphate acetyltransferase [Peptococcaceae bacterium SCADC1_2_3]KFI34710.1 bifunctional N-acetylglucosamine-1-phosphate uridyltransferase/glucosamine-1-phosphate acetyltransferase [Peptococcaceae bacterium SCADC1_2_3]